VAARREHPAWRADRGRSLVVLLACLGLAAGAAVLAAALRADHKPPVPTVPRTPAEAQSPFARRASAVCAASSRKRGRIVAATGPRQIAHLSAALLPVYDHRLRELGKLEPPVGGRRLYSAWLRQLRRARSHLVAARRAGLAGDAKGADFNLRLFAGAQATSEFLAEQLHVEGCAEQE